MWTLARPDVETAEAELLRALTYKDDEPVYPLTADQRAAVMHLYLQYDAACGRPSEALKANSFGEEFLAALYAAYGEVQEGHRLANLRDRLKAGASHCPYCGFGEIRDLDHHLPRSIFKALAIYARNLIPCCSGCNNKKRTIAGHEPAAQFAHVYLDPVPDHQFFRAAVEVSEVGGLSAEFRVEQCDGMTDELYERLKFQVSRLALNDRYAKEVTTLLQNIRSGIEMAAEQGAETLQAWLNRTFKSYRSDFGLNDWRTALLFELRQLPEFYTGGYQYTFGRRAAAA